jgi:hypothetical protein
VWASAGVSGFGNNCILGGVKTNKMNAVPFLIENKRSISQNWLLGLTVGGYGATSLALYCLGGALVSSRQVPAGNAQALLFLIPGFFVGLLDFAQIHAEDYFKYKPRERITWVALWLNATAIIGLCSLLTLKGVLDGGGFDNSFVLPVLGIVTAASFLLGIVISVLNVLWILIAAKARIALVVTVVVCVLPALWPAYRAGLFTRDAGRYATRQDRIIYLHPSDTSFQIPQDWLYWDTEFHNNLHLTHRELTKVRFGAGEWDTEYGDVVNSALPFQDCAAHVGGEGWGRAGVSFADLQLRAYVTDLSSAEILRRISGPAFATAKRVSSPRFHAPVVQINSGQEGEWHRAVIQYDLFYGDYGGRANIEFYIKPVGQYQLVMVFMGNVENEKRQVLDSVTRGNQSKATELNPNSI